MKNEISTPRYRTLQRSLFLPKIHEWFLETLHKVAAYDGEPHGISAVEKLKHIWMDCNADPIEDYLPLKFPVATRAYYRRNAAILSRWEDAGRHGLHFFVVNANFQARNVLSVHVIWDDWFFFIDPPINLAPAVIYYAKKNNDFLEIPEINLKVVPW